MTTSEKILFISLFIVVAISMLGTAYQTFILKNNITYDSSLADEDE